MGPNGPWTVMQSVPQGHNSGHFTYPLPTTSADVWIQFRYQKGTATAYQDLMWVDDVRLRSNLANERYRFPAGDSLSGWTAGGTNGGFVLAKPPAARAAGPSENLGADTTIYLERSVYFAGSTRNSCSVTYATDMAATHDFRVYEGSNLLLEKSGKSNGTATLAFSDGIGSKVLKFAVSKDAQPDAGRDLVRVEGITCYSNGETMGHYDFDGQAPGSLPYSGWYSSCTGTGCAGGATWLVHRATPHDSYVPMQAFGSEAYNLDGLPKEYLIQANSTRALVFDELNPGERKTGLELFADATSLYTYFRLNAVTPGVEGDESGWIYLLFDDRRGMTIARNSECGGPFHYMSGSDRMVSFYYSMASGTDEYAVAPANFGHWKGDCAGSYEALGRGDAPVVIEAHLLDPGDDSIGLEVKVDFWGGMVGEQLLGLGFKRYAYNPNGWREFFPFYDYGGAPPDFGDVYSWETVRLSSLPSTGPEPTERVDSCCVARRDWL